MRIDSHIRRRLGTPVQPACLAAVAGLFLGNGLAWGGPATSFSKIDEPASVITTAVSVGHDGERRVHRLMALVVLERTKDWETLREDADFFFDSPAFPDIRFDPATQVGDARRVVVRTSSVARAIEIAELARESLLFDSAFVAQRDMTDRIGRDERGHPLAPVTSGRGGPVFDDPLFSSQWYIDNPANPARSNNLLPVYAMGYTGQGVTTGLISLDRSQFESDYYADVQGQDFGVAEGGHPDLAQNIDMELSQPPNTQLPPSEDLTAMAGLIAAVANNNRDIVGIAHNARIAGLVGGTAEQEALAINSFRDGVDIQIFEMESSFSLLRRGYFSWTNNLYSDPDADFVIVAQQNALRNGRGGRGAVQIFGTGGGGIDFPSWERYFLGTALSLPSIGFLDVDLDEFPFSVFVPPDDPAASGFPFVSPGPRIHYQQLVADPRAIVVAPVSQNESFSYRTTFGTEVLTSVFAEVDPDEPDGMISLTYSPGPGGDTDDYIDSNGASAVLGGIVALMLEANPNLGVRDIQHILVKNSFPTTGMGYDPSLPYGVLTDWQVNAADPAKPHSDRFGFGLLDAHGAIEDAISWNSPGQLFILDTGTVGVEDGEIPDSEYLEIEDNVFVIDIQPSVGVGNICVRQNFTVEQIVVTLNVAGEDHADLLINLLSPQGTSSLLHLPNANSIDSTVGLPYFDQRMVTFKHWGEAAGGNWRISFTDFSPDEDPPEGDDEGDAVTFYGQYGYPGSDEGRSAKTIENFRVQIYARDTGLEPFDGCPPGTGTCPGDLNADGVINTADLQLFFEWYLSGDLRADINRDGVLNFADILAYRAIWRPGFCGSSGLPFGRPTGPSNPSPNNPVVRPI